MDNLNHIDMMLEKVIDEQNHISNERDRKQKIMKSTITHVNVGASEIEYLGGGKRKYSPVYIHRKNIKKEVHSYNLEGLLNIRRAMLIIKWFLGMLSFEEELYLQSLFPKSR